MDTHLEHEVKLQVPRRFDLRLLDATQSGYAATAIEQQKLITTYYDTDDLRLTRWGTSLRYRKAHGWTIKVSESTQDGNMTRVEHNFPDDGGRQPPAEALNLLTAFVRTKKVSPVASLRTQRTTLRLHGQAGENIAEVADDDVRVIHDGHVADRFREVEVELLDGAPPEVLGQLTRWLQDAGAGQTDDTSKVVRALGLAARAPAELEHPTPTQASTGGDVIRHALATSVRQLLCQDAPLRLTTDPEVVHKARVATRRLRSDLRSFRPLLDEQWTQSLRDDIGWLADELGTVRDGDVLVARLQRCARQLAPEDAEAAEAVIDRFSAEVTSARQRLTRMLRERRYVELLDELVGAASEPKLLPQASEPASLVLPPLVAKRWKKLCKAADRLDDQADDNSLHQLRIKAKRCRYAALAIWPIGGEDAQRFAKRVERLQTMLGDLHDAVVAEGRLRTITGDREDVFAAGGLAALEAETAARARAKWRKVWKQAAKKKLRFWC